MTIEESLLEQFTGFSLVPERHTANLAHLYADYVELMALIQNGDWFSAADLVKRFKDYDVTVPEVSTRVAGPALNDEPTAAEIDDRYDSWAQQVFSQIAARQSLFAADYAFDVDHECIRLTVEISARQKIYLMLVLCSNLKYVPKLQSVLTADFEQLAAEVMKVYLPASAFVKQLGKNSDYAGDAQDKIRALAADMKVALNAREFNKILGTQERGLDLVGWIPFKDEYANLLSILGQCACGKDWHSKLSETRRFDNSYFVFEKLKPIHALFVPRSLTYRKDLYQSDELSDVLLFERSRILQFIRDEAFFDGYDAKAVVEYAIEFAEDLV